MIPAAALTEWRSHAPWPLDAQVEQDLVLSRALCEMFSVPAVSESLAFRGGTALHKMFANPAGRYSEDIDLVQRFEGPNGPILDGIRAALDPWLGAPGRAIHEGRAILKYKFAPGVEGAGALRLKVEINTREHFALNGVHGREFAVTSLWYTGAATIPTFGVEELLATKMRALYQRKKGRDLYDLWLGLAILGARPNEVAAGCVQYMARGGATVTRAQFETNLADKLRDEAFRQDATNLLATGQDYDVDVAAEMVSRVLISRLPGSR